MLSGDVIEALISVMMFLRCDSSLTKFMRLSYRRQARVDSRFEAYDATGGVFDDDVEIRQHGENGRRRAENDALPSEGTSTNLKTSLAGVTLLLLCSIGARLSSRRLSTGLSFASGHCN